MRLPAAASGTGETPKAHIAVEAQCPRRSKQTPAEEISSQVS
ncbi:hypothetical protein [Bacillus sp. SJS]|nr:hypothetical protein [Bacillus sp. SJS]